MARLRSARPSFEDAGADRRAHVGRAADALDRADIKATLGGGIFGMGLVGGTPAQTNRFIDDEEKRWGEVIRTGSIRAQ